MATTVKGMRPGMMDEAQALVAKATAGMARVNVSEVVTFLLQPVLASIEQQLQHQPHGNVFVVEVSFASPWHNFISQGLQLQKLSSDKPLAQALTMPGGKEVPNIIDLAPLLASVAGSAETAQQMGEFLQEVRARVQETLLQDRNIYLVLQRRESLPQELEFFSPKLLKLQRFNPERFQRACASFYDDLQSQVPLQASDLHWVRHIEPSDFLVNTSVGDADITASIRSTVNTRLRQLAAGASSAPLEKFNGIAAIVEWADDILRAAGDPDADSAWRGVSHGALLQSGDALYVGEIAKAVAAHCGFAFFSTSILELMSPEGIRVLFDRAWTLAPVVLFIENFEGLPDPRRMAGEAKGQQALGVIRTALLRQLDSFRGEQPVIVIGSTIDHETLDPAYRLPGRMERVFVVPKPTKQALAGLFKEALSDHDCEAIDDADFLKLGQFAGNMADIRLIGLYVAHAARRAKTAKRPIHFEDLRDAMLRGTAEGGGDDTRNQRHREQTAYHEAGHAAIAILDGDGRQMPEYATIVPGATFGGFVLPSLDKIESSARSRTYADCVQQLRLSLAARAVEEIKYGIGAVSTGAGGGPGSDLHKASVLALMMFAVYGFSADPKDPAQSGKCVFVHPTGDPSDWMQDPVLVANARQLLDHVYLETRQVMRDHWALVELIAQGLITDDMLDESSLLALYARYQNGRPKG